MKHNDLENNSDEILSEVDLDISNHQTTYSKKKEMSKLEENCNNFCLNFIPALILFFLLLLLLAFVFGFISIFVLSILFLSDNWKNSDKCNRYINSYVILINITYILYTIIFINKFNNNELNKFLGGNLFTTPNILMNIFWFGLGIYGWYSIENEKCLIKDTSYTLLPLILIIIHTIICFIWWVIIIIKIKK